MQVILYQNPEDERFIRQAVVGLLATWNNREIKGATRHESIDPKFTFYTQQTITIEVITDGKINNPIKSWKVDAATTIDDDHDDDDKDV